MYWSIRLIEQVSGKGELLYFVYFLFAQQSGAPPPRIPVRPRPCGGISPQERAGIRHERSPSKQQCRPSKQRQHQQAHHGHHPPSPGTTRKGPQLRRRIAFRCVDTRKNLLLVQQKSGLDDVAVHLSKDVHLHFALTWWSPLWQTALLPAAFFVEFLIYEHLFLSCELPLVSSPAFRS